MSQMAAATPTADPGVDRLWPGVAGMLNLVVFGFVGLVLLWTIFINFVADEAHQPLDFYSNKLRTRPYWLVLLMVILGGGISGIYQTGQATVINEGMPEVAIACYLQGLSIGLAELFRGSAGQALATLAVYGFAGPGLVMVVLVPTLPLNRPGVFYSILFFGLNMVSVSWVRMGIHRHIVTDGNAKPWPPGSEKLFEVWSHTVYGWNPVMCVLTSLAYGVEHLQFMGEYGWACALAYYVIAALLVVGCCRQFSTGTALED